MKARGRQQGDQVTHDKPVSQTRRAAKDKAAEHTAALATAIDQFRAGDPELDAGAQAVLARLLGDDRAARTLATICKTEQDYMGMFKGCIHADCLLRTFSDIVDNEKKMPAKLQRLREAIDEIRALLKDMAKPSNPLAASITHGEQYDREITQTLYVVRGDLDARERVAAETVFRLGATRKASSEKAAETAAIGWLADSVRRTASTPHYVHAAILAEIALGIGEVETTRLREALRTRDRDWRVGFVPLTTG